MARSCKVDKWMTYHIITLEAHNDQVLRLSTIYGYVMQATSLFRIISPAAGYSEFIDLSNKVPVLFPSRRQAFTKVYGAEPSSSLSRPFFLGV